MLVEITEPCDLEGRRFPVGPAHLSDETARKAIKDGKARALDEPAPKKKARRKAGKK